MGIKSNHLLREAHANLSKLVLVLVSLPNKVPTHTRDKIQKEKGKIPTHTRRPAYCAVRTSMPHCHTHKQTQTDEKPFKSTTWVWVGLQLSPMPLHCIISHHMYARSVCLPSSLIFGSFRAFTDVAPDFNPLHVARHRRRSRSRSSLSLTPVAKAKGKQQTTNRPPLCRPVRANQRRAMPPVTLALPFLSEGAAQSRQRLHCHALLPRVCMQCMYVV